ncbi:MAG TPA: rhomboid family intramembrane serine protease [Ktedonobacteraceae bacterium]|nr:rhomboid family intramembrane serine protease [Ktedonobacteraceae bacterium]
MEAQTDLQTYLEQGKQALAHGQGREAAIAYAHAAQLEPDNPLVHLGLAEANLALGSYGVVHMASRKTQELESSGPNYDLAQALLDLLDRRYPQALQRTDAAIKEDPGNGYAHALRAYLLRVTGQDYDAGLARSRASRLSYGGTFENCFPQVEPVYANGYNGRPTAFAPPAQSPSPEQETATQQREQVPTWSRPNTMQRRAIRTRFWLSQNPRFVTYLLIFLNVAAYLVLAIMSGNLFSIDIGPLVNMGAQAGILIQQGDYWRIFTAMFLHVSILHVAMNMLSLFFIGPTVELVYGKWRYLLIYLLAGIVAGLASQFTLPANVPVVGASGAIAGIFGALGAFFIVNRRALGPAGNAMIGQWVFWLVLNIVFNFSASNIAWQGHLGGLIAGLILGIILLPPLRSRTRRV